MRKITLLFAVLFVVAFGYGQTPMSGTYKVGVSETSPNFTSLKAATDALNSVGMNGNVIFEITSDLLETASSRIGVNTGTFSITIRPDLDVDRKIEFNLATDNARASGLIIIGMSADSWDNLTNNTHNVTIDGFASGGNTRRLTLATTDDANIYHGPVQIVGESKNITVKNCILNQRNLATGSTTYAIRIRVEKNVAGTVFAPSDVTIENNIITAVKNTAQMGIGLTFATGLTANTIKNVIIKNNEITARTRGVSMSNNENIVIEGNTFKTEQISPGMLSTWIQGISNAKGDIKVKGNKFISALTANTSAGDYGIRGIIASGGGTWYIENNFFTGFKVTGTSGSANMIAIRCGNTCYIRNNTFLMNSLGAATEITPLYQGILIAAGTPEIKNNILISDEDAKVNTLIAGTNGGASDYNILYLKAGNTNASINGTYATLAEYQTANPTKDMNSKSVDVTFTDAATGNLHLATPSVGDVNLAAPLLASVSADIDGTVRTAVTYMGAHQPSDLTTIAKLFTVTVPAGTEKVYVAGSFTGKNWDNTDPLQLAKTSNANEFAGILPCADGVEYKYLCEKGDWDYQEASSLGSTAWNPTDKVKPTGGSNRTYNASDVVTYWVAQPGVKLNVNFAEGSTVPSKLFVKGSWDNWTTPIELTSATSPKFSGMIGNGTTDLIYSNIAYKYYTTDEADPNWEANADGNDINDRWSIYPSMNDEIARFKTQLSTGIDQPTMDVKVLLTPSGISVRFDGDADIELYSISGQLIEKTRAYNNYDRDLHSGIYIIRVNGNSQKFVR